MIRMNRADHSFFFLFVLLGLLFLSTKAQTAKAQEASGGEVSGAPDETHYVEITIQDFAFVAPSSVPSGWVTFQVTNEGEETHHLAIDRFPESKTYEDLRTEVIEPLDSLDRLVRKGVIDPTERRVAATQLYPDWLREMEPFGGIGRLDPGQSAKTTLKLKPGEYVMNCFVDSSNGHAHKLLGMAKPFAVDGTTEVSASPISLSEPDVMITTSGSEINIDGAFRSGKQTVGVHVEETGAGTSYSSADLARLGPEKEPKDVAEYDGSPAPVEFLGGPRNIPAGQTAYLILDLKPARYAWRFPGGEETKIREFRVE